MMLNDQVQKLLGSDLDSMNRLIEETLASPNEMLNSVVGRYLRTKGKQIRPIIVLLSARMHGRVNEKVLCAGAALEMLHNASLIHDDVIDNTVMRRGAETINSVWNNHIAVLAGDYFVSKALEVGVKTGNMHIIAGLSKLGVALSTGEIEQISNTRSHRFDEAEYMSMIQKKTASLFMHCMLMGASTAGYAHAESSPMKRYAELLGVCFQIRDDIFDYFPGGEIGKPTGNDLREGKVTLPLLYALRTAPAEEAGEMRKLLEKPQLTDEEIQRLIEFAIRHGGIEYAEEKMRGMKEQSENILMQMPRSEAADAFSSIFQYIIDRDR